MRDQDVVSGGAAVASAVLLVAGVWAFAAPASFFEVVAPYEPYNAHLIRDIGAFQLGFGAAALLALRMHDARRGALLGIGVGAVAHVVGHVLDRSLGGRPWLDIPGLALLSVLLILPALLGRGSPRRPAVRPSERRSASSGP